MPTGRSARSAVMSKISENFWLHGALSYASHIIVCATPVWRQRRRGQRRRRERERNRRAAKPLRCEGVTATCPNHRVQHCHPTSFSSHRRAKRQSSSAARFLSSHHPSPAYLLSAFAPPRRSDSDNMVNQLACSADFRLRRMLRASSLA